MLQLPGTGKPNRSRSAIFGLGLLVAGISAPALGQGPPDRSPELAVGQPWQTGQMASDLVNESSGLAASRIHPRAYWTHNDNGRVPGLFLIRADGQHLGTVHLEGAGFTDWEAVATVHRKGRNLVVVGDMGDNRARRDDCRLFVFEEPQIPLQADSPPRIVIDDFQTIEFRYPDGPQDCEAMAVQPDGRRIWLVSKQRPGGAGATNSAGRNGNLEHTAIHWLDWPDAAGDPLMANRLDSRFDTLLVTGLDFSPDNRLAVIRTYFNLYLFERQGDETWQERMTRAADLQHGVPLQRQGEAVAFAPDSRQILLTSEGFSQPIWRLPLNVPESGEGDPPLPDPRR